MKVCQNCGVEIYTKYGENLCYDCNDAADKETLKRLRTKHQRRARHQAMLDLGLVRVRGAMGGIYYE